MKRASAMTKLAQYRNKGLTKKNPKRSHFETFENDKNVVRVKKNISKLVSKSKYWKTTNTIGECEKTPNNLRNQEYPIAQGLTVARDVAAMI
jgi:hypothetical protein